MGTSATVRLIEGVRLIWCSLNTGFTVYGMWANEQIEGVIQLKTMKTLRYEERETTVRDRLLFH